MTNRHTLGGFKTTEINFLAVLEARRLKSRRQQGFPSRGSRGGDFLASTASGGSRCSFVCGHVTLVSASIFLLLLPVSLVNLL